MYKINYSYLARDPSSAGEHYAEDVGVPGSTPGGPTCSNGVYRLCFGEI